MDEDHGDLAALQEMEADSSQEDLATVDRAAVDPKNIVETTRTRKPVDRFEDTAGHLEDRAAAEAAEAARVEGGDDSMATAESPDRTAHLRVLGLASDASDADIKRAHRSLAKKHHPDKGGASARFQQMQAAYEALKGDDDGAVKGDDDDGDCTGNYDSDSAPPFLIALFL